MYCANTQSTLTGGSKTITVENMPAHSHSLNIGFGAGDKGNGWPRIDTNSPANQWGGTQSTGGGKDYMPPYITVYAWYRKE